VNNFVHVNTSFYRCVLLNIVVAVLLDELFLKMAAKRGAKNKKKKNENEKQKQHILSFPNSQSKPQNKDIEDIQNLCV